MSLIIDTSQVAPSERFDLWVRGGLEGLLPHELEQGGGSAFSGSCHDCELGPVGVHRVTAGPLGAAADAADDQRCGPGDVPARARAARPQPDGAGRQVVHDADGNAVRLPDARRRSSSATRPTFQMLVISFPLALLGQYTDRMCARTGGASTRLGPAVRRAVPRRLQRGSSEDSLAAGGAGPGETIVDVVRSVFLHQGEARSRTVTPRCCCRRSRPTCTAISAIRISAPARIAAGALHLHTIAASPLGAARGEHLEMDSGGPAGALPPGPRRPGARAREHQHDRRALGDAQRRAFQPHVSRGVRLLAT